MKQLTVGEAIKKLRKYPKHYKLIGHEKGSVYDSQVVRIYESDYDKKKGNFQVTILTS